MRRRSMLWAVAGAGVAAAAAGATAALAARAYLKREYARPDPAADDDFSVLSDATHHTVESYDGGTLHLLERGRETAQPVLLVHGVTLAAEVWQYQLRDLADRFRVIAVDQRGHGKSKAGHQGYGLDRLGHDIASVLEVLDLKDVVIVGHSMGGFATQRFCIDHPQLVADRVAGIVLVNTAAGGLLGGRSEVLLPVAKRVVRAGGRRPKRINLNAAYLGTRWTMGKDPSQTHVRLTYQLADAMSPDAMVESIIACFDMDLLHRLNEVKIPALVVTGGADRLTPPRYSKAIAEHLPDARLRILPDCGHMSMLERHDELTYLISMFADELGPAGRRARLLAGVVRAGTLDVLDAASGGT